MKPPVFPTPVIQTQDMDSLPDTFPQIENLSRHLCHAWRPRLHEFALQRWSLPTGMRIQARLNFHDPPPVPAWFNGPSSSSEVTGQGHTPITAGPGSKGKLSRVWWQLCDTPPSS